MIFSKNKIYKIFISSSFDENFELGFEKERESIRKVINDNNRNLVNTSLDGAIAYSNSTKEESLKRVRESDFFVLLIGTRYGTIRENDLSLTHLEYNEAIKHNIPILAYEFPRNINNNDRKYIENFVETIKTNDSGRLLSIKELYPKEFNDVIEHKSGITHNCEEQRIDEFCRTFASDLLNHLLQEIDENKEIKSKSTNKIFMIVLAVSVFAGVRSYFYGKNKGIVETEVTLTLSKKLKNEIETLSYKIRHTKNDSELIDLKKEITQKEKRLERITLIHEMDTNKEISKILERNGTKAAYDYATTNTQNIKIENDEKKLSTSQLTRAILAFEVQRFEESNAYCRKAMLNYPAFKVNIWCSASLVMQDKKNEGFKVLSETLKLPYLKDEEKAMIYTHFSYSDKTKFKMYFEKAIEIYKNKDLNKYYSTLIEYSNQLLIKQDKTYLEFLNILDDELGHFSNNADLMFEYWQLKAKYNRNINNGEEAVVSIMQADKYKNNIAKSTDIRISQYLELKTTIFKEQNEIKYLEKLYLDNLEYALNSAKKFPIQIDSASLVFKEVIGFYEYQRNYKKQEELFVKWAKFLKDYCRVENKLPISRYSDFLNLL